MTRKRVTILVFLTVAFTVALTVMLARSDTAVAGETGPLFIAGLRGSNETTPVETITRGLFIMRFASDFSSADFRLRVTDGTGITAAHIHCAPDGVDGPIISSLAGDIPGGLNVDGLWINNVALTDANIVDNTCGSNLQELADAAGAGQAYVNVHSVANPGGEIRGRIVRIGGSTINSDIANFTHQDLSIRKGTTVKWTNRDGVPHTSTSGVSPAPDGIWNSGTLLNGQSFSQKFDQVGVFPYFCMIHPFMTGTVTVTQ